MLGFWGILRGVGGLGVSFQVLAMRLRDSYGALSGLQGREVLGV